MPFLALSYLVASFACLQLLALFGRRSGRLGEGGGWGRGLWEGGGGVDRRGVGERSRTSILGLHSARILAVVGACFGAGGQGSLPRPLAPLARFPSRAARRPFPAALLAGALGAGSGKAAPFGPRHSTRPPSSPSVCLRLSISASLSTCPIVFLFVCVSVRRGFVP